MLLLFVVVFFFLFCCFFFHAEDGIRDVAVTGVQTCALPILAGNIFAGFAANRSVRYTLLLVALMIGTSTALFPYFATGLTGAAMLIALWGFAFGAFPACASIWMFVVAPEDVERGMPLFVELFQVIIALGSFFGGRTVVQMGT